MNDDILIFWEKHPIETIAAIAGILMNRRDKKTCLSLFEMLTEEEWQTVKELIQERKIDNERKTVE